MHQSPDMRQERESAKLAREQLVPAVGQRARRKPMGQPARLVSMVVLKALAQQVPVSTQSVRLTMRPALVQTQPVRCLQTLHMPGKIVPAYQLYFRSGRSTPSCASLPQIGLIAIASMLLFVYFITIYTAAAMGADWALNNPTYHDQLVPLCQAVRGHHRLHRFYGLKSNRTGSSASRSVAINILIVRGVRWLAQRLQQRGRPAQHLLHATPSAQPLRVTIRDAAALMRLF